MDDYCPLMVTIGPDVVPVVAADWRRSSRADRSMAHRRRKDRLLLADSSNGLRLERHLTAALRDLAIPGRGCPSKRSNCFELGLSWLQVQTEGTSQMIAYRSMREHFEDL